MKNDMTFTFFGSACLSARLRNVCGCCISEIREGGQRLQFSFCAGPSDSKQAERMEDLLIYRRVTTCKLIRKDHRKLLDRFQYAVEVGYKVNKLG